MRIPTTVQASSISGAVRAVALALCLLPTQAPADASPRVIAAAAPAPASPASPVRTSPPNDAAALRELVLELDRRMFDAFNAHDVNELMSFFAPDLEFYHDKDGLLDRGAVMTGFTRVFANNPDLRRDLVPGTVEVHPLPGYGALQVGRHRFCHTEDGKADCGTFAFVQVWRWSGGEWRVSRELSYGH
jgi:ketosteroid isomerase-like protein